MFVGFGFAGACLLTQAIYFPIIAGLEAIHSYNVAIGKFGIAIFGIVASWFLTKKTGKRAIFLVGAAVNCVVMFVVGGLYYSYSKGALWGVAIITISSSHGKLSTSSRQPGPSLPKSHHTDYV